MNILFLSIYEIQDSNSGYIYADLIHEFALHEHNVYAVTPTKGATNAVEDCNGVKIIKVRNGQIQKTGKIRKTINLLTLENKTINAVKKYAKNVKFDLVINMCSNLCFSKTSAYFRKRDKAKCYLLLKDFFPQNAVYIVMMKTTGLMGFVYRYFRSKERKLYRNADFIGCMSQANVDYVLAHNSNIPKEKLAIVPNSIEPCNVLLTNEEKAAMRSKYEIPLDKKVFVYGGNLGKPQGIPFIIDCLRSLKNDEDAYFFIVGDGTEYEKLEQFVGNEKQDNVKLIKRLPREDFDAMLASCDVGMIFLDHRFTIPNYPSRLLSYMQAGLPVLACTDPNSDVGKDIVENGFGWRCESNDICAFNSIIKEILDSDTNLKIQNSLKYIKEDFSVEKSYRTIMENLI